MPQNIVDVDPSKPIATTVKELGLSPRPLLILLGDFDANLDSQIRAICSRVIAPLALSPGALILDDAKSAGCAALMGQAGLEQDQMPPLLGIVPNDRAVTDIDPNHSLILRFPAAWSDTAKFTFRIADELVSDAAVTGRVIAVLFGGGEAEENAVIRCVRRGWPVLVLKGSGGLADRIMTAITPLPDKSMPPTPTDPGLREIVESASTLVYPSSLDAGMDDLKRLLMARIEPHPETATNTLHMAWARFDELDQAALQKQKWFRRLELALIVLAVIAALLAILTAATGVPVAVRNAAWLHILVILTPILISIIGAYNSHFRDGNKWILLRGSAEAIKREIFRFRAQAGAYSDQQCLQTSRESKLAARIKDITSSLEQSEVNKTNLEPPNLQQSAERDSFLTPDQYITVRIQDQVDYFVFKTRKLSAQLTLMQVTIYLIGGAGTFLAAIHLDVWVALATAVVTAFSTKLQADQVENSLVQYNQSLASLRNVKAWWNALSPWEKDRRTNIDLLVEQSERTLESETAGWVQQMQSTLDKLTEKEPSSTAL
jgi:hypothetical protein